MKIEGGIKTFEPITITLESRHELAALISVLEYGWQRCNSMPLQVKREYMYLDLYCDMLRKLGIF